MPYGLMRSYATWPLASLEVLPGRVKLRVAVLSLVGGDSLDAQPGDLTEVSAARGRFGTSGVAFRTRDGRRFFFWTRRDREVLGLLASQGFPVSSELRSESNW